MKINKYLATLIASMFIGAAAPVQADFQPGSVLVSVKNTIYEYALDGSLLSTVTIPSNGEQARDLVVLDSGDVAVFNGTFNPTLAIYDGSAWQQHTIAGWSTVNNASYGGIAAFNDKIYLTDTYTYGNEAKGIIAFDAASQTSQAIVNQSDYIDVTVGQDGLLYALRDMYGNVDVISPTTQTILRSVSVGHTSGSRAVTANAKGELLVASWNGYVAHHAADGTLLTTLQIDANALYDIDINETSTIVVSNRIGDVYIIDPALQSYVKLTPTTKPYPAEGAFVALSPLPKALATPELKGYHWYYGKRHTYTILSWTTQAAGVDIYRNNSLLQTNNTVGEAAYVGRAGVVQSYKVCNTGTLDCSLPYLVK